MKQLAAACGDGLRAGIVLYGGDVAVSFGPRLWAAPLSHLFGPDLGDS